MAEALFQHLLDQAGLSDQIEVDSAGTSNWNVGKPAHRGTREVLLLHGIACESLARQVSLVDLHRADYVVAMDPDNVDELRQLAPRGMLDGKLHLLLDFAPPGLPHAVPDPIYDGRFELVYNLIEAGCQGLLEHIRAEHSL
jgi:protein-tyrosine phosphatase